MSMVRETLGPLASKPVAGDVAAGLADSDGETAEGAGNVVENDLQPDGIGGGWDLAHGLRR